MTKASYDSRSMMVVKVVIDILVVITKHFKIPFVVVH